MNRIKELQELTTSKVIAKALDINNIYVSEVSKRDTLSPKLERRLDNLSYTQKKESENYILTLTLECKK